MKELKLSEMIILGTPSVTLDFGIPGWGILVIICLMILSYYMGKRQGSKPIASEIDDLEEAVVSVEHKNND